MREMTNRSEMNHVRRRNRERTLRRWMVGAWILAAALPSAAQQPTLTTRPSSSTNGAAGSASAPALRTLTVDLIYGPDAPDFSGTIPSGTRWLDDGKMLERRDGRAVRIDPESGEAQADFDEDALRAALRAAGDFDDDALERFTRNPGQRSRERGSALLEHKQSMYRYDFGNGALRKFADNLEQRDEWQELDWSPKASFVSYVHKNDLYTIETNSGRKSRLTDDGSETRLNGVLDWLYQEEIYGRGEWRAYWWHPDEKWIAFLQLDQTNVPLHTIVDPVGPRATLEQLRYPKAGDPNPLVKLGVCKPDGSEKRWIDLTQYANDEPLVVRVGWAPDGLLMFQVQDRLQTWLDLNEADPQTGKLRTLFRETSPAWVNVLDEPQWLKDGTFLWESERDGWRHLYHFARSGNLIGQITRGEWDVRKFHGVSEDGWVYFSGTADTPIEEHAYRVRLAGGQQQRLTQPGFSHSLKFERQCRWFIDTFSNCTMPPKVHLRRANGELLRVISENDVAALREIELPQVEFVRPPARDGHLLYAKLVKPRNWQPNVRYPVLCQVYGGPQSPMVENQWGGRGGLLDFMLAQEGYLIWECDPRIATGGAVNAWPAHKSLGASELADLEDSVAWLVQQGLADPQRVGISGYSYGGYFVAYALTHSKVFSAGFCGAPVVDWKLYDTVYTERYLSTPQLNPEGYESSSALRAAKELHGRLLLLHGVIDENVHIQNSYEFLYELQKHRKQIEFMAYPRDRHGIVRGQRHFVDLQVKFVRERL